MKIAEIIARWVFIICFSLLLVTSTIRLGANNVHLYEHGFDKYHISEATGIGREQLSEVARRLVDYFNFKLETPQITVVDEHGQEFELFQENGQNRELTHLEDVRRLFQFNYRVQLGSLAYIIIYVLLFLLWRKGRWQDLAGGVWRGSAVTLAIIAVLGIGSFVMDFEQLFIRFHYLAFDNPWWMSTGYLPRLFPECFWQYTAFLGAGVIAVVALIFGIVARAVPVIHYKRKG